MRRVAARPLLRALSGALALALAAAIVAFRLGRSAAPPPALWAIAALLCAALAGVLASAVVAALGEERRLAAAGEALAAAGLLAAALAGASTYLGGLAGAVLLPEREPVRLDRAGELTGLAVGPLADRGALAVTLALARLELRPAGREGFTPVSRLQVLDAVGEERAIQVTPRHGARAAGLVFHGGAFGFAPRLTVSVGGRAVLDRFVPFHTVLGRDGAITFEGTVEVPEEALTLRGAVTLRDLNDDMKGHPTLELEVEQGGAVLGGGRLRPGEFAEVGAGLRVGFSGLQRWSEVLFSLPGHGRVVLAGGVVALAGVALWALGASRRR